MAAPVEVEAAGGAVWRPGRRGPEVLLVHRPRHGDWTLPKGKLDPGEAPEAAALREVEEETGLRCELGAGLPEVRYVDGAGRRKRVRYWAMRAGDGVFVPNAEVDEIHWVPLAAARAELSYRWDEPVLDALRELLAEAR